VCDRERNEGGRERRVDWRRAPLRCGGGPGNGESTEGEFSDRVWVVSVSSVVLAGPSGGCGPVWFGLHWEVLRIGFLLFFS
jgi:hypothetical protein